MGLLEIFGDVLGEAVMAAAWEIFLGGSWAPPCKTQTLFGVWWNSRDST